MLKTIRKKLSYYFSSNYFFITILVFFILESLWIALSAAYPQAFDENFHFGLIKIYARHLSPFLTKQPKGGDPYGDVAVHPSYLYHYLMSFPYRIYAHFFHNKISQIIFLRIIDIILFSIGLIYFFKFMLEIGLSKVYANLSILILCLIPIVPQLAGQINYDNMMFLFTGLIAYLTVKAIKQLRQKIFNLKLLITILILIIIASLVKFAYEPIGLAEGLFLIYVAYQSSDRSFKKLWKNIVSNFKILSKLAKTILIICFIIAFGLFFQRDGLNLIKYHTINPPCNDVLTIAQCSAYSVWLHNYVTHQELINNAYKPSTNIIIYLAQWVYWIWYRLFFAVSGVKNHFNNYPPLPLPSAAFLIVSALALLAFIRYWRKIFKTNDYINLMFLIIIIYLIALIFEGFETYLYTNVLELMNGRYLIPILLFMSSIAGFFFVKLFAKHPKIKIFLTIVIVIMFLEGGGALTFISRSDSNWLINNTTVQKVNKTAKKISKKIIITRGKKHYDTSFWFF